MKTPEDLAGLKIRTLPNPVITECLRLMGAAATPLAFGEIYTALQAGVLDGLEHDPPTILASKFFETAKFYALTQHNFSPLAIYFSDVTYNRMDPKLREGFLDAAKKAAADTRTHGLAVEKEALTALTEKGVTVAECDREASKSASRRSTRTSSRSVRNPRPIIDIIRAHARPRSGNDACAVPLSGGRHGSIALLLRVSDAIAAVPAGRRSRRRLRSPCCCASASTRRWSGPTTSRAA